MFNVNLLNCDFITDINYIVSKYKRERCLDNLSLRFRYFQRPQKFSTEREKTRVPTIRTGIASFDPAAQEFFLVLIKTQATSFPYKHGHDHMDEIWVMSKAFWITNMNIDSVTIEFQSKKLRKLQNMRGFQQHKTFPFLGSVNDSFRKKK